MTEVISGSGSGVASQHEDLNVRYQIKQVISLVKNA